MQRTGTWSTADTQNQQSSKDSIAITAELLATTSCDIRVQPCVYGAHAVICYELYMAFLHTCSGVR